MVNWNTSVVGFLTVFVTCYIISLSTYTYISSLSNADKTEQQGNRLKRDAPLKYTTDLWQKNITLNKCCGPNQIINFQNKCEGHDYKTFNQNEFVEKLEFFVVDENLKHTYINPSRVNFAYNYYEPTLIDNSITVNWVLNDEQVKTNFLFLQKDARLIELDDSKQRIEKTFSTSSYCLDENNFYGGGLIAYVNPCIENTCFKKCCPKKYYYNTMQQECVFDKRFNYEPEFYFTTTKTLRDIAYYLLHGTPNCSFIESFRTIHQEPNDTKDSPDPIYIQEDGYLLMIDSARQNYYYYDNKSYCIDLFSNGVSPAYLNGFYCQKEASFTRPADVVEVKKNPGNVILSDHKLALYGKRFGREKKLKQFSVVEEPTTEVAARNETAGNKDWKVVNKMETKELHRSGGDGARLEPVWLVAAALFAVL
ncbi:unnamed protein product [Phyllotreta striolata]|uniref:Uncharacterized protein n=1 Tax=Phyllotreta striolata TaxID=444603 RepID=A0A9N9TG30_PHYSR|nr:unnamed protein product [Phyllotreta striolata]